MNDDSHDLEKMSHTIGRLISRVEAVVNHFHRLEERVDRLENKTNYSLDGLEERIDTIERNHRFMSYKIPDSLSRYYGHKLLPGLNPDDVKEDEIKHEKSKDEDLPEDLNDDK